MDDENRSSLAFPRPSLSLSLTPLSLLSPPLIIKVLDDEYHTAHSRLRLIDASLFTESTAEAAAAYESSRIPGARFYDSSVDGSAAAPALPPAADFQARMVAMDVGSKNDVIIYDRAGMTSAPKLWWMLRAFGHERCAVLDGGLPAWIASGYPTDSGVFEPKKKFSALATTFEAAVDGHVACAGPQGPARVMLDPRAAGGGDGALSVPTAALITPEGNLLDARDLKKVTPPHPPYPLPPIPLTLPQLECLTDVGEV